MLSCSPEYGQRGPPRSLHILDFQFSALSTPRLCGISNMKVNSMDEKQSFTHGPGSHLCLHTCQEEIQPDRPHLPEIKTSPRRTVMPGALPLSCAADSCFKVVTHASLPGLFYSCRFPRMTLQTQNERHTFVSIPV